MWFRSWHIWIYLENSHIVQISELSAQLRVFDVSDSVIFLIKKKTTTTKWFFWRKYQGKTNRTENMSTIHAMNSNSNSPTDPLRHNLKVNGIISQNNAKTSMGYSPLALTNNINLNNNNNNHITNNNSNADNSSGRSNHTHEFILISILIEYTKKDQLSLSHCDFVFDKSFWNMI